MIAADDTLRHAYETQSYVLVRGLFDRARVERLRLISERVLEQWRGRDPQTGKANDDVDAHVMRHLNHSAYYDAATRSQFVELMEAVAEPSVLELVRCVIAAEPVFRTTSLFFNPRRTQDGNWHRDSQFVTQTDEEERQRLFGSTRSGGLQLQIALVPTEDAEVVPGSHLRWDTDEEYHIRKADGCANWRSNGMPGAVRVALEPGDAVAFNPKALHRGRYHADKLRRTLMFTYSADSVKDDWFTRQPWFLEPDHLDGLSPHARQFFERFVELARPAWEAQ